MSALTMEHRIHLLSKTSQPALTASYASYRRPRLSFEDTPIRETNSSFLTSYSPSSFSSSPSSFSSSPSSFSSSPSSYSSSPSSFLLSPSFSVPPVPSYTSPLSSSAYRRRRWPRAASSPPPSSQCNEKRATPTKSHSTSRSSQPKTPSSPSSTSPSSPSSSSSSSSSTSPSSSSSAALVTDADFIQTVFPPKVVNNQVDMDLAMFTQIAEITDCLLLSAAAAVRHDRVRQRMITHIINCTLDIPNFKAPGVECINIQVDDSSRAHLGIYFDRCADLIRHVSNKGGRVLVHCVAGISRSASLCIAYLMKYERMSLHQAYRHVKRKRSVIHPNVGFWRQLIDYEKRIFGTNSVKMVHSNMGMIPDVYAEEATHIAMTSRSSRYR